MATAEPGERMNPEPQALLTKRAHNKFGLGVALTSAAVVLFLLSFLLIWFGVFPGLVAIVLAIPLAIAGVRLIRRGEPATTTTVRSAP